MSLHGVSNHRQLAQQPFKLTKAKNAENVSMSFDLAAMGLRSIEKQKCNHKTFSFSRLTHWGRLTHICVTKLTIIGSDNGLSPARRQATIWISAGMLLIRTLGTNFSDILSEIHIFSFKKMYLKMLSAKWWQFRLGLSVLTHLLRV